MPENLERAPISNEPISIVLPVRNPGSKLGNAVAEWKKILRKRKTDFEIIIADDCSDDEETLSVLAELEELANEVTVLHQETPSGIGACLRAGFSAASHPLLAYCPVDGGYDAAETKGFLEEIDKVDLVVGYRKWQQPPSWMKVTGGLIRGVVRVAFGIPLEPPPCWLGWPGAARRWFVRWTFGVYVHDADCAFRLLRREILERITIQSNGAFVHAELLAKANFLGCLIAQVPVSFTPSVESEKPGNVNGWDRPSWKDIRRVQHNPLFLPIRETEPTLNDEEPNEEPNVNCE